VENEAPRFVANRLGKVFERKVAPPDAPLSWLLEHPADFCAKRPKAPTYGCSSPRAQEWRRGFFDGTAGQHSAALEEARASLTRVWSAGSFRKEWEFEGFTSVDCCLITDKVVILVEGKRTEKVSGNVLWYPQRNQLWRNVEAAQRPAEGRDFGVIVGVEFEADGKREMESGLRALRRAARTSLSRRKASCRAVCSAT
jgi:hypothetical protein